MGLIFKDFVVLVLLLTVIIVALALASAEGDQESSLQNEELAKDTSQSTPDLLTTTSTENMLEGLWPFIRKKRNLMSCETSDDCDHGYTCMTRCSHKCSSSKKTKKGFCPPDNIRCIQAEPDQCKKDGDCQGKTKCCYSRCGLKCVRPTRQPPV